MQELSDVLKKDATTDIRTYHGSCGTEICLQNSHTPL